MGCDLNPVAAGPELGKAEGRKEPPEDEALGISEPGNPAPPENTEPAVGGFNKSTGVAPLGSKLVEIGWEPLRMF
jgi:hypothetical protein